MTLRNGQRKQDSAPCKNIPQKGLNREEKRDRWGGGEGEWEKTAVERET